MKRCPLCGRNYPNDANFCPMDAGKLVDAPSGNGAPGPSAADDALTTQAQLVGGRFRPLDKLGGSLTGEVLRARDGQANVDVALKLVAPTVYPTPLALERAQRELKQLAKLMSPRVVRVLDSGKLGDKQLWIAMELVNGRPLSTLVGEGGPFDVARASRIVVEIGEALIEAQKVGVVHRDVAPKNVLIENASGGVRLTNFAVPVPVSDKISGVVEYLSPEQAEGKPVDQRSNIYSLGALYYYLIVGQPPFVGDVNTVMRQHINAAVTPPSQRVPGIPPEADQAITKALEKSSSRRHLTLRQLLNDVEKLAGAAGAVAPTAKDPKKTIAFGAVVPPGPGPAGAGSTTPGFSQAAALQAAGLPGMPTAAPHAPTMMPGSQSAYAAPQPAPLAFAPPPQAQAPLAFAPPAAAPQQAPLAFAPPPAAPQPAPLAFAPPPAAQVPTQMAPQMAASQAPTQMPPQPQKQPQMGAGGPSGGGAAVKAPSMSKGKKGKKDAKFRETMWFKKGALEEQLAQQPPPPEGQEPAVKADTREIDEKYQDDGTLSAEDRQKHSLRSGATQSMAAVNVPQQAARLPGERMSAADIAKEYQTGRKWLWVVIAVGVLVVGLVVFLLTRSSGSSDKKDAPPAGGAPTAPK